MPDGKVAIWPLRYNNYYNRILKREQEVIDYEEYLIGSPFYNIDFKPNDGINTQIVLKPIEEGNIPDYILVVDGTYLNKDIHIVSRWFVIDATRLRKDQYNLTLYRDTLADYYNYLKYSTFFAEKAPIRNDSPFIFNEENITLNQIKEYETLLMDETESAWIVGYMPSDNPPPADGDETGAYKFKFSRKMKPDYTVNTLADFNNTYINTENVYRFVHTYKYRVHGLRYNLGSTFDFIFDRTTSEYKVSYPGDNSALKLIKTDVNSIDTAKQKYMNSLATNLEERILIENYLGYEGSTAFDEAYMYDKKIIYEVSTRRYYRIKTNIGFDKTISQNFLAVGTELFNKIDAGTAELRDLGIIGQSEANMFSYSFEGTYWQASIQLEELNDINIDKDIQISVDRQLLQDAPYSMFCIPVDKAYMKITRDGSPAVIRNTADKQTIYDFAVSLTRDLSGAGILTDLQLLPYCPFREVSMRADSFAGSLGIIIEGESLLPGIDYQYTETYSEDPTPDTSGYSEGVIMFWCKNSTFSFELLPRNDIFGIGFASNPYDFENEWAGTDYPWTTKLWNETKKYRLSSPNYSSSFDFSPAKNGGVRSFTVDCTYKPFQPYIHVAPLFGGLYGDDFNDYRGLTCGGDFSLPQLNDAWATYERQNINYQKSFQRDIESMELHRKWSNASNIVGALSGAGQAGIMGGNVAGMMGAEAAGMTGAGLVAGGLSLIGGAMDAGVSDIMSREAIRLKQDQFGYQLGNIQALPNTITKISAFTANNKIFPVLETYGCTQEELQAFINKLVYNGLTCMRIDTFESFLYDKEYSETYIPNGLNYIKGHIVRMEWSLPEDYHVATVMSEELSKGVYV